MLHIKLTGMKQKTQWKHISCPFYILVPTTPGCGQKVKIFFSEKGHVAYQILSVDYYASKMFDLMHIPDLLSWVQRSVIEIVMD